MCFLIALLSIFSPFLLRCIRSSHARALSGIRCSALPVQRFDPEDDVQIFGGPKLEARLGHSQVARGSADQNEAVAEGTEVCAEQVQALCHLTFSSSSSRAADTRSSSLSLSDR